MKFQLLRLCYDDPLLFVNANFTVFERIQEHFLAEHAKTHALWHRICRKSLIWEP
jgi:hypothetical protein